MKTDTELLAELLEKDFGLKNLSKKLSQAQEQRDKQEEDFHDDIYNNVFYSDRYGKGD